MLFLPSELPKAPHAASRKPIASSFRRKRTRPIDNSSQLNPESKIRSRALAANSPFRARECQSTERNATMFTGLASRSPGARFLLAQVIIITRRQRRGDFFQPGALGLDTPESHHHDRRQ